MAKAEEKTPEQMVAVIIVRYLDDPGKTIRDDFSFENLIEYLLRPGLLTDRELADKLLVSRPTVNRWARGRNLPQVALRGAIYQWANKFILTRIYSQKA